MTDMRKSPVLEGWTGMGMKGGETGGMPLPRLVPPLAVVLAGRMVRMESTLEERLTW